MHTYGPRKSPFPISTRRMRFSDFRNRRATKTVSWKLARTETRVYWQPRRGRISRDVIIRAGQQLGWAIGVAWPNNNVLGVFTGTIPSTSGPAAQVIRMYTRQRRPALTLWRAKDWWILIPSRPAVIYGRGASTAFRNTALNNARRARRVAFFKRCF